MKTLKPRPRNVAVAKVKLLTLLLELAQRLWDLRKSWRRRQIEKEHQDETKELEQDPDAWFDDFFEPGVQPDGRTKPSSEVRSESTSPPKPPTE